jgi:hypothetical protein
MKIRACSYFLVPCLLVVGFCAASAAHAQVACTSCYQPAVVTVYRPITPCCPTPPPCCAPVEPAIAYQPVAQVRTRYRPLLGGSVTRVRYGYAPTYVAPVMFAY